MCSRRVRISVTLFRSLFIIKDFPEHFGRYVFRPSSGACRTTYFIESIGVTCSDSVCHDRVQVLSIPVLLLACSQDWTSNLHMIVSLEA